MEMGDRPVNSLESLRIEGLGRTCDQRGGRKGTEEACTPKTHARLCLQALDAMRMHNATWSNSTHYMEPHTPNRVCSTGKQPAELFVQPSHLQGPSSPVKNPSQARWKAIP